MSRIVVPVSRRHFVGGLAAATGLVWSSASATTPFVTSLGPREGRIVPPRPSRVGAGLEVKRTMPVRGLAHVDPFLLLDQFEMELAPGSPHGVPAHPHRGFETATVMMEGQVTHRDSTGTSGTIERGDVQWMTAGAGIVHEEMPSEAMRVSGGRLHGLQLWVNLPARLKMTKPRYQDTKISAIPVVEGEGVRARIVAGAAHGAKAVIATHTPVLLVEYEIAPGAQVALPLPSTWNAFLHVASGALRVPTVKGEIGPRHLCAFEQGGDGIFVRNEGDRPAVALLGAGEPIDEPMARRGPFVMNTQAEIRQAWQDYRSGRMGRLD